MTSIHIYTTAALDLPTVQSQPRRTLGLRRIALRVIGGLRTLRPPGPTPSQMAMHRLSPTERPPH